MPAILLVTLLIGTNPSTYHVNFDSMARCQTARVALIQDMVRLAVGDPVPSFPGYKTPRGTIVPEPPSGAGTPLGVRIRVSAICVMR